MYEVGIIYILIAAQGGILQNTKTQLGVTSNIIVADFAPRLTVTNNKGRDGFCQIEIILY